MSAYAVPADPVVFVCRNVDCRDFETIWLVGTERDFSARWPVKDEDTICGTRNQEGSEED